MPHSLSRNSTGLSSDAPAARFARVAIYWLPPADSALAAFGRDWLGAVPETGADHPRLTFGLPEDLAERAVATPRRYGLHATLKAPFALREDVSADDLCDALRHFCARRRLRLAGPLRLKQMGSYLTLMPDPPRAELDWLADECVTHFDHFRAPLSEAERARRQPERLSARQRDLFDQFGYPYVLSDFRFHVTLAGPLAEDDLTRVHEALAPAVAGFTGEPLIIDSVSLLGDPGQGALFRQIARVSLVRARSVDPIKVNAL